jgi:hypothetical protein
MSKNPHNTLLAETFAPFFPQAHRSTGSKGDGLFHFATLDMIKNTDKIKACIREEASWRRMLTQQSPIMEFVWFRVTPAWVAQGRGDVYL